MDGRRQSQNLMSPWTTGCFVDAVTAAHKSAEVAVRDEPLCVRYAASLGEIQQLSEGVRHALECPVCKELSGSMSACCDNGHGLCDECLRTMSRLHPELPVKCPLCRSPPNRLNRNACRSPPTPPPLQPADASSTGQQPQRPRNRQRMDPLPPAAARKLNEFMSVVKVTCAYRSAGCPYLLYVLSAAMHESLCPHAPHVRCMVPCCQWSGAYGDAFQHVSTGHQFSAYDVMVNMMYNTITPTRSLPPAYASIP